MDINNYLYKNENILKLLIYYCKEIEVYKKEIEREEEEIKSIITTYLKEKEMNSYETKYCKAIIRTDEQYKNSFKKYNRDFAAKCDVARHKDNMRRYNSNKTILEIKYKK